MVNRIRGEVPLEIEGERFCLCLTLGALAEIESGLGLADLTELEARLARPRIRDIVIILAALLRGGGHDIQDAALSRRKLDLKQAGQAIAQAFMTGGFDTVSQSQTENDGTLLGEADAPQAMRLKPGGAGFL